VVRSGGLSRARAWSRLILTGRGRVTCRYDGVRGNVSFQRTVPEHMNEYSRPRRADNLKRVVASRLGVYAQRVGPAVGGTPTGSINSQLTVEPVG